MLGVIVDSRIYEVDVVCPKCEQWRTKEVYSGYAVEAYLDDPEDLCRDCQHRSTQIKERGKRMTTQIAMAEMFGLEVYVEYDGPGYGEWAEQTFIDPDWKDIPDEDDDDLSYIYIATCDLCGGFIGANCHCD